MSANEVFHARVYFTGHVQGVGFRYQTMQVAREFEVSGYVRNLPDGRVQLEAEGDEREVGRFIAEVEDRLDGYIRRAERSEGQRQPEFRGFRIA
jgi:acylphosphatase